MNMQDIKRITIVSGPAKLAYDFDRKSGALTVWLGEQVKNAPTDAKQTAILPGNTSWSIFEGVATDRI